MLRLILRRLALGLVTVVIVSGIIFAGVEVLPGDACTAFLEREAEGKRLENCRRDLGLDRGAITRYLEWAAGAIRGDPGVSANGGRKIADIVGDRLKNSLLLALLALGAGVPTAILLGVVTALWRDRLVDLSVSTLAIMAMTIPEFVSATVLILVFSIWLGWIPGIVLTPADAPASEFFPAIILPVVVLSMVMTAHILRMVRSSVIEVLASDFARACVEGGQYNSVSEVAHSGLRLLKEQEERRQVFDAMIARTLAEADKEGTRRMDEVLTRADAGDRIGKRERLLR